MKNKIYEGGYVAANAQAAIAISPCTTDEVVLPERLYRPHWEAPPKTRPVPNDPSMTNYTGKRFGRLSIIGLAAMRLHKRASWIARCVCGTYEVRSSKEVATAKEDDSCCHCEYTQELKARGNSGNTAAFEDTGPWRFRPPVRKRGDISAEFDMTGKVFDHLTVIGCSSEQPNRWVVRCACSLYELRTAKQLKRTDYRQQQACFRCRIK